MDTLVAWLTLYGLAVRPEGQHTLRIRTRGYTRAEVLAALHSVAESIGCVLVVLPHRPGELRVAVQ